MQHNNFYMMYIRPRCKSHYKSRYSIDKFLNIYGDNAGLIAFKLTQVTVVVISQNGGSFYLTIGVGIQGLGTQKKCKKSIVECVGLLVNLV